MKIKAFFPLGKIVNYYGLSLQVPIDTRWVATDECGHVYAYAEVPCTKSAPFIREDWGRWQAYTDDILVCEVDLEDIDWKDTLKEYE